LNEGLQDLVVRALWPLVEAAFRNTEDHVESRVFRLGELQAVVSRPPVRGAGQRGAGQIVTVELWPALGPRVLVVEWSGRRPYIVQRRPGDWLRSLARVQRASR